MTDHSGYIYVVDLQPMGLPGYKIGYTRSLKQRMTQLEVPQKGTLVKWFYVNNVKACEKALHKMFKPFRVPQSEWFKIHISDVKRIPKFIKSWKKSNSGNSSPEIVSVIKQKPIATKNPEFITPDPIITKTIVHHEYHKPEMSTSGLPVALASIGIFIACIAVASK